MCTPQHAENQLMASNHVASYHTHTGLVSDDCSLLRSWPCTVVRIGTILILLKFKGLHHVKETRATVDQAAHRNSG